MIFSRYSQAVVIALPMPSVRGRAPSANLKFLERNSLLPGDLRQSARSGCDSNDSSPCTRPTVMLLAHLVARREFTRPGSWSCLVGYGRGRGQSLETGDPGKIADSSGRVFSLGTPKLPHPFRILALRDDDCTALYSPTERNLSWSSSVVDLHDPDHVRIF